MTDMLAEYVNFMIVVLYAILLTGLVGGAVVLTIVTIRDRLK